MFFINYILFLLIILFTHIIALNTQLLSLLEMIKYDQYHDFLKRIFEIARKVKVSIPDELYKYDHDTFEKYIHALWDGLMSSCSTLKVEV